MACLTGIQPVRTANRDVLAAQEHEQLLPKASSHVPGSTPGTPVRRRQFTVEELQNLQPGTPVDPQAGKKPVYESLDYEEVENIVYRSDKAASSSLDGLATAGSKWLACFLIGVATATAAFLVNLSVENIAGFKFWATLTILSKGYKLGSFLAYASMNMVLVLASVGITLFVGPAAAGSGIPDVKAYLNGIDVPGIFYFNTLVAKVLGSVAAVAGGLAIGKEGPFVHAGACIAALISQGGLASCQVRATQHLWNDRDRADMVTAGAAAGVAAAFRSPVGGVLFALEEMSSWWRNQLMWLIFFTTAVVSVTVRVLMKACSAEHCGFFGSGGFIYFEIQEGQEAYEVYELLPMLLLGVVGGLLGSCFIVLNARLGSLRRKHLARYGVRGRLLEGAAVSLLTSTATFILPMFFVCQQCPSSAGDACPRQDDSHSGNFVAFGCTHPNQYSDLATLFFNTQDDAIRALFSSSTKREYTVPTLVLFVTAFYWLAVLTYGLSCPTGLFVPSILCGAAYGRLVGIFVADMYPHQHIDEGTYALLGAASFLGGSMRMTMCTCVMLLELTNNLALLPLIMLVLLVAKAVGDGTGIHPIYEVQMKYKGLPFLEPSPDAIMRHLTAKECCGQPPITLNRVERVQHIVDVLKSCNHNGFPVLHTTSVEGDKALAGVVLRQHLLLLLNTRNAFQAAPYVTETASRVATSFRVADFCKPISAPGLSVNDVQLSMEELCQYLDLGPYLNPSYYVVQEDASLSKVYTLFRTLGLRHLCVIPKAQDVVGIITREDLRLSTLEGRLASGGGQFGTDGTQTGTQGGGRRRPSGNGYTPGAGSQGGGRGPGGSVMGTPGSPYSGGEGREGAVLSGRSMLSRMQQWSGSPEQTGRNTRRGAGRSRTGGGAASGGIGGGFGNGNFGGNIGGGGVNGMGGGGSGRYTEARPGIDLMPTLSSRVDEGGVGPSSRSTLGRNPTAGQSASQLQGAGSGDQGALVGSSLASLQGQGSGVDIGGGLVGSDGSGPLLTPAEPKGFKSRRVASRVGGQGGEQWGRE